MKKRLCFLLIGALLLCFTGCQKNPSNLSATGEYNGQKIALQLSSETDIAVEQLHSFEQGVVIASSGTDFFMISADGKRLTEEEYHFIGGFNEDGYALAQNPDGEYVYLNTAGAVVESATPSTTVKDTERYDSSETTGEKSETGDYLFGVKDSDTGEHLTKSIFTWIASTENELNFATLASGEHRQVMISPRGEVKVYLPDNCNMAYLQGDHIICRFEKDIYRLADKTGQLLCDTAFTSISPFSSGKAVVTSGAKMGIISDDGVICIEPQVEIDQPVDNNTPLIWNDTIACIQNGKLTIIKAATL